MTQRLVQGVQIAEDTLTTNAATLTPSSVAATGTVTGSNLSGINTGDQTITLTSDVTGSGTGSFTTTLATVNSNVGTFSALTVNGKGLVTSATNLSATSDVTGTASGTGIVLTLATVNGSPQSNTFRKSTVNGKGLTTATSAVVAGDITTALGYTPVNVAGDTMTGYLLLNADPTAGLGAATKAYVDLSVNGLSWKTECKFATTAALPSLIYANGSSGVGATLTGVSVGTLSIDSGTLAVGNRVLVKNQVSTFQNGIYNVTTTGSGIAVFILTRAIDMNTASEFEGSAVFIGEGSTNVDTAWVQTATVTTVGTDPVTFVQFGAGATYSAGTGLTLSSNTFSITNTGTAGTYGQVTTNAQGQVTSGLTRTITGTINQITVTNGDGVSGNPTLSLVGLKFGIQATLVDGENATATINQYAPFGYTIDTAKYQTDSGTITVAIKINGTNVTGLSALSLSSTPGSTNSSGAFTVVAGDLVTAVYSSNSSAANSSIMLLCTRT